MQLKTSTSLEILQSHICVYIDFSGSLYFKGAQATTKV